MGQVTIILIQIVFRGKLRERKLFYLEKFSRIKPQLHASIPPTHLCLLQSCSSLKIGVLGLPCGAMVRTPRFHCQGIASTPDQGTKIPQTTCYSQKQKRGIWVLNNCPETLAELGLLRTKGYFVYLLRKEVATFWKMAKNKDWNIKVSCLTWSYTQSYQWFIVKNYQSRWNWPQSLLVNIHSDPSK